tara:strand:- start:2058 stop:2771 length:714 start_codon:yes stop_codon:yes gene_type:complete
MTLITHNGRNVLSNNPLASPLDVGSYSIVNEISQLNNLPTEKRKPGLLIHVLENNGFYVLKNRSYTFTISDWQSLSINSQEDKVFYDREVPLGLSDGVNKIFTLVHEPKFGSEHVYLNGLLQDPSGKNNDYTISDNIITFIETPVLGSKVRCSYRLIETISPELNISDKEVPSGIVDGLNREFLLNYFPEENSEHVYLNGLLQDESQNADYVIYENKIIFNFPPLSDSKVKCSYRYL